MQLLQARHLFAGLMLGVGLLDVSYLVAKFFNYLDKRTKIHQVMH